MFRRFVPLALAAACASKGGEGARGQGETPAEAPPEVVVPPAPEGAAWKTARGAAWDEMLKDLADADVVFVGGGAGLELPVLDYLYKRGRLHAIGLGTFPRTAQKALDDFCFGRIDVAELERRCGAVGDVRPVLLFAAELRLPVLALAVEPEILAAVEAGGIEALTEEQRRSLPAVQATDPKAEAPGSIAGGLRMDVPVDVVVRWYRDAAPEGAQMAVLGTSSVPPRSLPERLLTRSGKSYRTVVSLEGKPEAATRPCSAARTRTTSGSCSPRRSRSSARVRTVVPHPVV
jgi:hypothetical protein